jgi:hypothetical protein
VTRSTVPRKRPQHGDELRPSFHRMLGAHASGSPSLSYAADIGSEGQVIIGRLNLFHNSTDRFSCWGFQRPASCSAVRGSFRLAAFVHHCTSVASPYRIPRVPNLWIVPSQGESRKLPKKCTVLLSGAWSS